MAMGNLYSSSEVDGVAVTPRTIQKPTNEARQAITTGRVRYILAFSSAAAIVALAVVWSMAS